MMRRLVIITAFICWGACGGTDTVAPVDTTPQLDNSPPDSAPLLCPESVDCSDGLSCTEDSCAMPGEVCSWALNDTHCLIDGVCRNPTEVNPNNPCELCDPTQDQFQWTAVSDGLACDDGDACTVNEKCLSASCSEYDVKYCEDGDACTIDGCDPDQGCSYELKLSPCCGDSGSVCDDGNPCTTDACDEQTLECDFQTNSAPCTDGDSCTTDDQCKDGGCSGTPVTCDDGNTCTQDSCVPGQGCSYVNQNGLACSDGYECTTGDVCQAGMCVGDSSACTCVPEFGDALKVISLQIGENGQPGNGLDVDGDSSTCSPSSDCGGGVDNALGILATIANPAFIEQLVDGVGMVLIEFRGIGDASTPSTMALFEAKLDSSDPECAYQASTCSYLVKTSNFSEADCLPLNAVAADIEGTSLVVNSSGNAIPFSTPLNSTTSIVFDMHNVVVDADVTFDGDNITSLNGMVAGAVRKDDIIAAIQAAPDGALLVDKSVIVSLITFLNADIDTDGDGLNDALSIGLIVQAIDADITGLY